MTEYLEQDSARTNPLLEDSDFDHLSDRREVVLSTNAASADTDGDGVSDGAEVRRWETDPTLYVKAFREER